MKEIPCFKCRSMVPARRPGVAVSRDIVIQTSKGLACTRCGCLLDYTHEQARIERDRLAKEAAGQLSLLGEG